MNNGKKRSHRWRLWHRWRLEHNVNQRRRRQRKSLDLLSAVTLRFIQGNTALTDNLFARTPFWYFCSQATPITEATQ